MSPESRSTFRRWNAKDSHGDKQMRIALVYDQEMQIKQRRAFQARNVPKGACMLDL